ncbi:LLM class flavin-dependent oxidoreductase [Micromonospora sp. BRA006-A]|nr:LLM class flavin-dependent oxidoreductase [Micromonospora sp. BRA006-A]
MRLGFHPPREHIPIYLAAVGLKNLELAGEIADGWLAVFYSRSSPRSTSPRCGPGRAAAAKWPASTWCRPCRSWSATTSPPAPSWCAGTPRCVGGMGSRKQNFYNQLATRMGCGDAAREVQDLYLAKRQRDAAAAVPMEFIDRTSLLGPKERIAERMRGTPPPA